MPASFLCHIHIQSLLAADLAIFILRYINEHPLNADRLLSWMDLREQIFDYCILVRMKVNDPSSHYVALKGVFHPLFASFIRIADVCSRPKLNVMEDLARISITIPIEMFQRFYACHHYLSAQAVAN